MNEEEQRAWTAAFEKRQAKVRGLLAEREYDEAIAELRAMLADLGREATKGERDLESERASVSKWLGEVEKQREETWGAVYESGKQAFEGHNYKKAVVKWSALPKDFRDVASLAATAQQRLETWYGAIQAGKAIWKKGDAKGAIAEWEKALAVRPNNKALQKKIVEAKRLIGNRNMLDTYLEEARRLADGRDYSGALAQCDKVLEASPVNPKALSLITAIKKEQLERDLKAAIAKGDRLLAGGEYADAIAAWKRGAALPGADAASRNKLFVKIKEAEAKRRQVRLVTAAIALGVALVIIIVLALCLKG
jgi:tetratricopeptide (TPR) repeat protein